MCFESCKGWNHLGTMLATRLIGACDDSVLFASNYFESLTIVENQV